MPKREPEKPARPQARQAGGSLRDIDGSWLGKLYDPDRAFLEAGAPKAGPLSAFLEALHAEKNPAKIESATLVEFNRYGAYRTRTMRSRAALREAVKKTESKKRSIIAMMESGFHIRSAKSIKPDVRKSMERALKESFENDDSDPTSRQASSFDEYLPLIGGPFSKQLYLFDYLDMHRKAFEAWNHNPIAHQAVKIITHFVLGRGVAWKACHPECGKAFSAWADKNDLQGRLEYWSDMLSRDGEVMIHKHFNQITGELFLRWIDPSTIWEIVTDLEDIERVFYYHQQYPTQYQVLYGLGGQAPVYNPSSFLGSKYVINQIPADEVLHYKINCSPNEKRGRSDLFPVLGWLKRYKDFWTAKVLRAIIQSTFAWKNKLKGTDADVQAFINAFGTKQPEFGSVWVENEASELSPMTVDSNATTGDQDAPGVLNMIAVGVGVPKEYLGLGDQSTRATAVVASEPGAKKFLARQLLLSRLFRDISQAWARAEIAHGRLPGAVEQVDPETGEKSMVVHEVRIEPQFPEILTEDRGAKIKDIESAQLGGYISKARAATMIADELGIEGFDWRQEKADMAKEADEDAESLYRQPPGAPQDPGSNPFDRRGQGNAPPGASGGLSSADRASAKANGRQPV